MSDMRRYLACGLVLLSSLFLFSPPGRTQQVGEAVGVEGTAQRSRKGEAKGASLDSGDEVELLDQLRTQARSKLGVLLQSGHQFVLGENVLVSVEEQKTPKGSKTVLIMGDGNLRVVTTGRPGAVVVVKTPYATATAPGTEFIVSCGPPTTPPTPPTPDSCIFVGVHSRIQVESPAFPGRAVDLGPQFFTEVRHNQLPTRPQRMPDSQFQDLLDATTILGTGGRQDRIGAVDLGVAGEEKHREATGNVKLEISVRYAKGAPGPRTASWWSAIDSTFLYWFQDQYYDYHFAAYDSALPYAKPKHQWQGLEDWSNYTDQKPSGYTPGVPISYTPGAPISRVKISVWDEEGNEHLLVTNEGGWATMCGKIREAYDIGVHSREIQLAGRNAVIAGIAFEDLVLTERGRTVEIIVPTDASAPSIRIQEGAGPCCGTGVFYEGDGPSRQKSPQKTNVQMAANSNGENRQTTTNDEEGMFKFSIRLVHEEGTTAPGIKATTWWSNFDPSFLYWFGDRQPDYRFATFEQSHPYLKLDHHWQGVDEMNGTRNKPPDRNPGVPIPKVEVSVWDSEGNERVLATDENGWATFCGRAGEKYDAGINSSEAESEVGRLVIAGVALEDIELQEGGTIVEAIFVPNAAAPTLRVFQGGGICCAAGVLPWAGGAAPLVAAGAIVPGGPLLGLCAAGSLGCGNPPPKVLSGTQ